MYTTRLLAVGLAWGLVAAPAFGQFKGLNFPKGPTATKPPAVATPAAPVHHPATTGTIPMTGKPVPSTPQLGTPVTGASGRLPVTGRGGAVGTGVTSSAFSKAPVVSTRGKGTAALTGQQSGVAGSAVTGTTGTGSPMGTKLVAPVTGRGSAGTTANGQPLGTSAPATTRGSNASPKNGQPLGTTVPGTPTGEAGAAGTTPGQAGAAGTPGVAGAAGATGAVGAAPGAAVPPVVVVVVPGGGQPGRLGTAIGVLAGLAGVAGLAGGAIPIDLGAPAFDPSAGIPIVPTVPGVVGTPAVVDPGVPTTVGAPPVGANPATAPPTGPETGMQVVQVIDGGAAQKADLRANDILYSIAGQRVRNWDEFKAAVSTAKGAVEVVFYNAETKQLEKLSATPQDGLLGAAVVEIELPG